MRTDVSVTRRWLLTTKSDREQCNIAGELELTLAGLKGSLTLRRIKDRVERMAVSADVKALIIDIASVTIEIGETIVSIGRKIVSFALDLFKRFPNTAFGIVIALVLGALVSSAFGGIPLIGAILVAKLKAIMLLFGIARGALADISRMPIGGEVDAFVTGLNPLARAF
jgi:hypothetical protein